MLVSFGIEVSMAHIFLSYSRDDWETMQQVRKDLVTPFEVWTDEKIEAGTDSWKNAIQKAIDDAFCVVVIFSPTAKSSKWVRKELDYAQAHNKKIIPILAEGDETSSLPFDFIGSQWIDIRDTKHYQAALRKLIDDVTKYRDSVDSGDLTKAVPSSNKRSLRQKFFFWLRRYWSLPRWKKGLLFVTIVIPVVVLILLWTSPLRTFPQFGLGIFPDNTANVNSMQRGPIPCNGNCLLGIYQGLDIEANILANGYATTKFTKIHPFTVSLGPQILLRVSIKTANPNFEVALWDDAPRSVYFHCEARVIGEPLDFLINLDQATLTENGLEVRPHSTNGFSIGFSQRASSGSGQHHMEVYGILSGDRFSDSYQPTECPLSDLAPNP
jgi:hypothetical protein